MRTITLISLLFLSVGAFAATDASDDAIVAQAEKIMADEKPLATPAPAPAAAAKTAEAKEADMPVYLETKKVEHVNSSLAARLGLSVALLAAIAGALIFASKRWPKKSAQGGQKTRIDVLHQMHLGPKRSLSVVRVAGEVMLLGVTDHNVNLIKSITLIDDELETLTNQNFNNFLEDEFSVEDVRSALNARA